MYLSKKEYRKIIEKQQEEILLLQKELEEAKQLKSVLTELAGKTGIPTANKGGIFLGSNFGVTGGIGWAEVPFPDTVAQYVDDYFGGKVIKQEATKVVVLDSEGNYTSAFTKEAPDKGYKYKLVKQS